jgi:hypothetical protein
MEFDKLFEKQSGIGTRLPPPKPKEHDPSPYRHQSDQNGDHRNDPPPFENQPIVSFDTLDRHECIDW